MHITSGLDGPTTITYFPHIFKIPLFHLINFLSVTYAFIFHLFAIHFNSYYFILFPPSHLNLIHVPPVMTKYSHANNLLPCTYLSLSVLQALSGLNNI